jgi:hypothetical protein
VADEHAATAVTEACTLALPTSGAGPLVLVACPEGEWHTLPPRMLAVVAGVRAVVLGPGLPAAHLERYLDRQQPDVLALSCTMPTNLLQARDSIAAAHRAGVPVVAGGRAFGPDGRRAAHLGADAWAASRRRPPGAAPGPDLPRRGGGAARRGAARRRRPRRAARAGCRAPRGGIGVGGRHGCAPSQADRRRPALDHAVRRGPRCSATTTACWTTCCAGCAACWSSGRLPLRVLVDGTAYLADALEPETPTVAALVRRCAARLS